MSDFLSCLPPEWLVRYARDHQAEIRAEVERARLASFAAREEGAAPLSRVVRRLLRAVPLAALQALAD